MKHQPIFNWDAEAGIASCILTDGQNVYCGYAQCHPDDIDMMSEKTGCEIALKRAKIELYKAYKKELQISLNALNHLYYTMAHSTHFNKKSYENKMLQRRINLIKFDLATAKEMIATEKQSLKSYLEDKDKFYIKIRNNRKKAKLN